MTATVAEARDAMVAQFRTTWDATGVPVDYQDSKTAGEFPPKTQDGDSDPTAWARFTILHNPGAGGQAGFRPDGLRRYDRFGTITVSIFTAAGEGLNDADALIAAAMAAFEGQRTTGTGIVFLRVRFTEVGNDGEYFQNNVICDFEYSEVR